MTTIGLIVNPIAGMGGSVGLKGTDGVWEEAARQGAVPRAFDKMERALTAILPLQKDVTFLACPGMGAELLEQMGFSYTVVYNPTAVHTSDADTIAGATAMRGAALLLFAGGDGTARNIYQAVGEGLVVLGVPAGVKIHSPVYAQTPAKAGELLRLFLTGQASHIQEAEVLDIDEEAYRRETVNTRLFGYLKIPYERRLMQNRKAPSPQSERSRQVSIANDLVERMEPDVCYLIGPGSTTRPICEILGCANTLIGVDLIQNGKLLGKDLSERQILQAIAGKPTKVIVTPIGGQGCLFGRGNQQLSPAVLNLVGKKGILVAATPEKIATLGGAPLVLDTGDEATDRLLAGYIRVTVGYHEQTIYPVQ